MEGLDSEAGLKFVHAEGGGLGVGAVVGDVMVIEELLESAVFADAAVEGDEDEGILVFGQLNEVVEGVFLGSGGRGE